MLKQNTINIAIRLTFSDSNLGNETDIQIVYRKNNKENNYGQNYNFDGRRS